MSEPQSEMQFSNADFYSFTEELSTQVDSNLGQPQIKNVERSNAFDLGLA